MFAACNSSTIMLIEWPHGGNDVKIAGTFTSTQWEPEPMTKDQETGIWTFARKVCLGSFFG